MESAESRAARQAAKQSFEAELKRLRTQAAMAGFHLTGTVSDPREDAENAEPMLIDAMKAIAQSVNESIQLAHQLGYNLRIDRRIKPLRPREQIIDVHVWAMRNPDGSYNE